MAKRDYLFDILKGIAIFMVVMGHILYFCTDSGRNVVAFGILGRIHMPLFFFISGWFAYKEDKNGLPAMPVLSRKFVQLMVPMIIVSALFTAYISHSFMSDLGTSSFVDMWFVPGKNGYWFPVTLFELFIVYGIITSLCRTRPSLCGYKTISVLIYFSLVILEYISPRNVVELFNLSSLMSFFPCFMVGVLSKKHKDRFYKICDSSAYYSIALVLCWPLLHAMAWPDDFYHSMRLISVFIQPMLHICLAIVGVKIIGAWIGKNRYEWASLPIIARVWAYIGSKSFGIYLLHYFFLFPLSAFENHIGVLLKYFTPAIIISAVCAIAVVGITIGLIELIRPSRALSKMLIGEIK